MNIKIVQMNIKMVQIEKRIVLMNLKIVQLKKNSSNEQYIYSFELLFISTTHVVPRAVVEMNNSSNGSSSNEITSFQPHLKISTIKYNSSSPPPSTKWEDKIWTIFLTNFKTLKCTS